MNNLIGTRLSVLSKNKSLAYTFVRNVAGAWNRDWKPGPYPITQAEREAAAKKYGLHIKDYKPYPDDGTGWGDYPMFDPVAVESRDPFEHYDYPEFRRNYGELLHPQFEWYTAERRNINKRELLTYPQQIGFLLMMISIFVIAKYLDEKFCYVEPKMYPETQMPQEGKKHYTFERLD